MDRGGGPEARRLPPHPVDPAMCMDVFMWIWSNLSPPVDLLVHALVLIHAYELVTMDLVLL